MSGQGPAYIPLPMKGRLDLGEHPTTDEGHPSELEKPLMLGKIEGKRRRREQRMRWLDGITELNGHEFEQTPGDGKGQGSLACCSPWGHKESDMTEPLNKMYPLI